MAKPNLDIHLGLIIKGDPRDLKELKDFIFLYSRVKGLKIVFQMSSADKLWLIKGEYGYIDKTNDAILKGEAIVSKDEQGRYYVIPKSKILVK